MKRKPDLETSDIGASWDVPKQRTCLRCRKAFTSEWSGERICARCKTSKAWKQGEPATRVSFQTAR